MFPHSLKTKDGLVLNCSASRPAVGKVRASVVLVHGLGDHGAALPYRIFRDQLADSGIAVYLFDLRGHGKSGGARVYVGAWSEYLEDLRMVVESAREDAPEVPLFLTGMSMGGLLALNFAQRYPDGLRGVVAAAPALDPTGAPLLVRLSLPLLFRLLPKVRIASALDYRRVSRDAVAAGEYTGDGYFQTRITPSLGHAITGAIEEVRREAPRTLLPLLLLHGTADTIVPDKGSRSFFPIVGSEDKTFIQYEGAYHNLFIETNRDQIIADVARWIEERS